MRASLPAVLGVMFLVGAVSISLGADYLKNTDFSEGLSCWRGDGEPAFLNPDGTEGQEGDKGVVAVLKIPLSKGEPRSVYQEFDTKDNPKTQHLRVDVFASRDFKRSKFSTDYTPGISNWKTGGTWYWSDEVVPNVDFWIRGAPGYLYKLANLKPGQWVTVDGRFDTDPVEERSVYFFVPAGDGTIYLRNPSATH